MKIAWYLGFGWPSILVVVASGVAINTLSGNIVWLLYVPFIATAVNMTTRFKLFNRQPWRRLHAKTLMRYAPLAAQEFDASRQEKRDFDMRIPCRKLATALFPERPEQDIEAMLGPARKDYYRGLLDSCASVFVTGIAPVRHQAVLDGIRRDIDASELGPDVVAIQLIERQLGQRAAADYFQARLLGRVN
mgnify:CR=1 FL=1